MRKFHALLISTLISCSAVRVLDSDANGDFKISNYETFDFYKLEGSGDTTANFITNTELLKNEIVKQLTNKGIRKAESNPDLLVNIGIMVEEKIQTRETTLRDAPRYMGQRNYSWKSEEIEVGRYKKGTVTVHLVDPSDNKLMWKGAVEGILPSKQSKLGNTIGEGMEALFSKLP